MKKLLYTLPALITIFNCSISLINCTKNRNNAEIQFITDGGYINDMSFNQQVYEAVEEFAKTNKINCSYKIPVKAAIALEAKLVIASGCLHQQALSVYAKDHKDKKFISCDFALGTNKKLFDSMMDMTIMPN